MSELAPQLTELPRRQRRQRAAAHGPFDMARRCNTPRSAGNHLLLRPEPRRGPRAPQGAHETNRRRAQAAPVTLANRTRTTPPERQHLAIKPPRRNMRGIDLRLALRERAALEKIRLLRRLVATRVRHLDLHLHPPPR